MTPVDDQLTAMYRDYLAAFGIDAVYPAQTLRAHIDAVKLNPEQVANTTRESFKANSNVDAIYFQGALLDPRKPYVNDLSVGPWDKSENSQSKNTDQRDCQSFHRCANLT